ncbi:MAG: NAD(P)-dependent oxidoreductase [Gammaproteobacteria bacterium]|nr:NAD(P)-dependent oxidoreductase [Gammaproteobacteria bacterium]NNF61163.1 NAD(P)-dependent oxidoreductase [Gammaproteobacteria bacterium]NNM20897.1 NAD(P)-dependent oxidoreductase [Gammaproteobacteria bacterium]
MSKNIKPGRLSKAEIEQNFADLHRPLKDAEALIAADRCYFCYDAPCTTACPTGIDIPGFIQRIRSGNLKSSAEVILSANIMGGMCARVCPTEVLCEEACVRNTHEDKPVEIGLLQRHATDPILDDNVQLFERAPATGKRIAVVGGGPAGLSCAHRLASLGHDVVVYCRDEKPGGLNEYGIAAYKTVDDFARREVEYILAIGGIELRNNVTLGTDFTLAELRDKYDAVFLGFGLGGVNALRLAGEDKPGVEDAVDYIAQLRQTADKSTLPVGRRVVVIGGGMTAIDIAVQSKRLGAEEVTIAYRRGPEQMNASRYEQQVAQTSGVKIRHWLQPRQILGDDHVTGVEFEYTQMDGGKLRGSGETLTLPADVVFKAIGQKVAWDDLGQTQQALAIEHGRIVVDEQRRTSLPDVWAGGDCVPGGEDLTVSAVEDGKVAASAINEFLEVQHG